MAKTKYRITVTGVKEGVNLTDYTNEQYNIYSGVWTLDSYNDLVLDLKYAIEKTNIAKGGGLASGYSFTFNVTNIDFVDTVQNDGVFFNNLEIKLEADTGSGYNSAWFGVIDSFKFASETTITFSCTDFGKARNEKFGSDKVPICLNRNYNCKVPETSFVEEIVSFDGTTDYAYVIKADSIASDTSAVPVDVSNLRNSFTVGLPAGSDWRTYLENYNGLIIEVVAGNSVGRYSVLGYSEGFTDITGTTIYTITVDKPVSDFVTFYSSSNTNLSIIRLILYSSNRSITADFCYDVHNEDGTYKKGLKINDSGDEFPLYNPLNYVNTNQSLILEGIDNNRNINSFRSISITPSPVLDERLPNNKRYYATIKVAIPIDTLREISKNEDSDSYLIVNNIEFEGILSGLITDVNIFADYSFSLEGVYKSEIAGSLYGTKAQLITDTNPEIIWQRNTTGTDVILFPVLSGKELDIKGFIKEDVFASVTLTIKVNLEATSTTTFIASTGFNMGLLEFRSYNSYKVNDLSIGTNGENVTISDNEGQFASVTDTIQYLQETYGKIATSNINTASYATAEADFEKFPSSYTRNAAHQIVESTDMNTVLKDILYNYNLGMFFGHNGQYYIRNFMVESYQFFNGISPTVFFNELNTINISKITRDDINTIVSDYELKWNYNEATGEYKNITRIKNTDQATFDFTRDTEGVLFDNRLIAEECWNFLKQGYNRSKKLSQSKHETKWTKTWFPEFGDSEAINFIRNQSQWTSRQHEYMNVTIPVTDSNIAIELLTFVSVNDGIILNAARQGWVVKRVLKPSNDTIVLTILLDIDQNDPFLENVNIIQDDPTETDEIVDDPTETDEIQDGDGRV